MAVTLLCGSNGSVSIGSRVFRAASWQANLSGDVLPATGYGSGGWSQSRRGLRTLTGSTSGYLEKDAANTAPGFNDSDMPTCSDGEAITLTADSGCTYTFSGLVSNIQISHSVASIPQITLDFVSSGPVVETWDEA